MKNLEKIIDKTLDGKVLEKVLREDLGLTKREISQAKFRDRGICINGERKRITHVCALGEKLQICIESPGMDTGKVSPKAGPLEILYEDKDVIVLNKPGGMPAHPGRGHYEDSLANRLASYLTQKQETTLIRAVGRLDKDTSGIMVFAKSQAAAARLSEQKRKGLFQKEYLAAVRGIPIPSAGRILEPIEKIPGEKMKMQVSSTGKAADTQYRICYIEKETAFVKCRIRTGRTHQIRVHMAWMGCPVLGDILYGDGKNPLFQGLGLHAYKVCFLQPFTMEKIEVQAKPVHWGIQLG